MSSCIEKLLGFIFEEAEFHRVSAYINPTNAASIRLINKMGFVKEGVLRDYFEENKFEDRALYSLISHITI